MSGQLDITILEPHGLRLQEMRARRTQQLIAKRESSNLRDGQMTGRTSWRANEAKAIRLFC